MTEKEKFDSSVSLIKQFCPSFKISLKRNSLVHRIIGWILAKTGNKAYMTDYITTLGQNVALPTHYESSNISDMWQIILHEGRHATDAQKITNVLFGLLYLFPQVLGILGVFYTLAILPIIACGGPLVLLWGSLATLFLAPLPACFRAYFEVRGYLTSLACHYWSGKLSPSDEPIHVANISYMFTSGAYYYMWPFSCVIEPYFIKKIKQLKDGTIKLDPYLAACKDLATSFK